MSQAHDGLRASLRTAAWRKSSFSSPTGNCVEVAQLSVGGIAVRNSRFPDGSALVFSDAEWGAFLRGVESGAFG